MSGDNGKGEDLSRITGEGGDMASVTGGDVVVGDDGLGLGEEGGLRQKWEFGSIMNCLSSLSIFLLPITVHMKSG